MGDLPATTAILSNNQIGKYISRENATILKNVFSATANGFGKVFYQPNEFTVLQDSYAFKFKDEKIEINKIQSFIVTALNKVYLKYNWGNKSGWNKIKDEKIKLPTKNDKIDFDFMDAYISELEEERISELTAYLTVSGLDNYELSNEEKEAIENISLIKWEEQFVTGENGVFNVKNTNNILSSEIIPNSGKVPYLCASSDNNSVSSYVSYKECLKDKGNCIFIAGKTFVVSYQDADFFSNDSHNLALYLKQENKADKISQLFLSTCIRKSLGYKYSWGDSISNKKIQKDKVMLPIKNHEIDFEYMERLISAVQKLVIKDVVEFASSKIEATKKIINEK